MENEEFKCKLPKTELLESWFSEEESSENDEECRICGLKPLAGLYLDALERVGDTEQAKELSEAYDTEDILTITKVMDKIRIGTEGSLRQRLDNLDCFIQSYKEE